MVRSQAETAGPAIAVIAAGEGGIIQAGDGLALWLQSTVVGKAARAGRIVDLDLPAQPVIGKGNVGGGVRIINQEQLTG